MDLNLETKRLLIRPIEISDAEFMLQLLNTEGWLKYIGDRNVYSINQAKDYIQKFISNVEFNYYVIELKSDKLPIGVLSFLKRKEYQFPDLGFALLPDFERNGFAFEAANEYLKILKLNADLSNLIAIVNENNNRSIQLLEKLGFYYLNKGNRASTLIFNLDLLQ
jgi:ribosomal-protein-alanine N-acetyltransferase